jgi:hypothetical protein
MRVLAGGREDHALGLQDELGCLEASGKAKEKADELVDKVADSLKND